MKELRFQLTDSEYNKLAKVKDKLRLTWPKFIMLLAFITIPEEKPKWKINN